MDNICTDFASTKIQTALPSNGVIMNTFARPKVVPSCHLSRAEVNQVLRWLFDAAAVLFSQVIVDVVDFPLDTIGIDDPEFRLVRIAAVDI